MTMMLCYLPGSRVTHTKVLQGKDWGGGKEASKEEGELALANDAPGRRKHVQVSAMADWEEGRI
jgi:hypothetical protein